MKIVTTHDPAAFKPKDHHWSAITENYCGCDDCHGRGDSSVGHGATEAEAIADLQSQLEES